jgi:hypothetical protein
MKTKNKILVLYLRSIFTISLLGISVTLLAQQSISNAVQITTEVDQVAEKVIFNANNQDFCDYVVYLDLGGGHRLITARPGISELYRNKITPGLSYSGFQYAMYRGNITQNPDIDFAYCLPVAKGDNLIMNANVLSEGYQMNFSSHSDTMYACRGGIVCNDDLTDFTAKGYQHFSNNRILKKFTIYHNDGTFGEYVFVGQPLVSQGQRITMGQPVVLLGTNKINNISFAVYFLDKNKINNKSIGNKHTHFRPFFQTNNEGKVRLEEDKIYFCELNNEMFMQDMSKRQRKKFSENK